MLELARFVAALLAIKPLAEALPDPVRVAGRPTLNPMLDRITRQAGVPHLTLCQDIGELSAFERVISDRLDITSLTTATYSPDVVARTVADGFDAFFHKQTVRAPDGIPLSTYRAGSGTPVILIPACGMPAALAEPWLRSLARDHHVMTWETRGLFGATDALDAYPIDISAQTTDLFAVMDHYGVKVAHVVGLCGGAVLALAAAAKRPDRITSLSLWHGAYEFSAGSERTKFQNDLIELMTLAATSRSMSRSVQNAFGQVALTDAPPDIAHFVLYPYANPELFHRYCRLNGKLATTDVTPYLNKVKQPALVVTSEDDRTAHPAGSKRVADGLRDGRLRIEPHGDHTTLFHAGTALPQVAADFIDDCSRFV